MKNQVKVIRYTSDKLRQEFQEILNDLSDSIQNETFIKVLGKDLVKEIRNRLNYTQAKLNQEFSLVIAGDFKRGKSTLINALLKTTAVTTDVLPETVTINEIRYGSELKIDACLIDGGQFKLEPEELKAEKLVPILAQHPNQVSHLKIETPVEWLRGLRLVDTPGTGDILKRFDSQVQAYLSQADVVVWVISALCPLSESEQAFLRLSVFPHDFPKLFFLVNLMDIFHTDEQAERLLNATQKKISRLFPHAHVFGVSALDEFCQTQSLPRPNPDLASSLESSFQAFRDCLQESIILNRDVIQLTRRSVQMEQLLKGFESSIRLLNNAIDVNPLHLKSAIAQCENHDSELYSRIDKHKQEMRQEIATLSEQTCRWIDEFIARLEKEAIALLPNFHLDDIRRHFNFFLIDKLRQAIQHCLDTHQPAIIESANKARKSIFEDFKLLTTVQLSGIVATTSTALDELPWTSMDTVYLVINFGRIGGLVQLLTSLLRQQTTDLKKSKEAINYRHQLQAALPKVKTYVWEEISNIYTNIAANIEQQIDQIYQEEIEASQAAMKQAQQLKKSREEHLTTTREGVQSALSLFADTYSSLKSFRQKLGGDNFSSFT